MSRGDDTPANQTSIRPRHLTDPSLSLFVRFSCPRRWSWESGEKGKRRPYLPDDKQFLVTRNIPCLCRAKDLLKGKMEEELLQLQEGEAEADAWVATGGSTAAGGGKRS